MKLREPQMIYIGTFGIGHALHGKVQLIKASSKHEAEQVMFEEHGKGWAFVYSPREFRDEKLKGNFQGVTTLSKVKEVV